MTVWAGVLAAGAGRRMGYRAKALLPFAGRTFLETIADTARTGGVEKIVAVIGYHADLVRPEAETWCDLVVTNPHPERGMGSSAVCLAQAIPRGDMLLLWPVDMPSIHPKTIATLLDAGEAPPTPPVTIPCRASHPGHPPLLSPRATEALTGMSDEERLDHFLEKMCPTPRLVEVDDEAILRDVDDQAALLRMAPSRSTSRKEHRP